MTGETFLAIVEQCLAGYCLSCVVIDRSSTAPCALRNAEIFRSRAGLCVAVDCGLFVVSIPICLAIGAMAEFNPFYFSTHHGALLDAFDAIDFDVDFWRRRGSQMSLEPDRSGYQSYAYSYALPARAPTDVVHYYVRK